MRFPTSTIIALPLLLFFGVAAAAFAVVTQIQTDDCPRLVEHPQRWEQVRQQWQKGQVLAVVRHAADCNPDSDANCINGNEELTPLGIRQAAAIGEGFRRALGPEYVAHHSSLDRTALTADTAFGESVQNTAISKPCKGTIQDYLEAQVAPGNDIFVTHSSCINSIRTQSGQRRLGFSVARNSHFGIAAFFRKDRDSRDELLGCVWPTDWRSLPG